MHCLVAALLLISCAATACEPPAGTVRTPAEETYDEEFVRWSESAGERLRTDTDPDIAWAGFLLTAYDRPRTEDFPTPPAPPTTFVGRTLRALHCGVSNRCPQDYVDWLAIEPDNAFVYALKQRSYSEPLAAEAIAGLRHAARYDDGFQAMLALRDKIAERTGEPPSPPEGYRQPHCVPLVERELPVRFDSELRYLLLSVPRDFFESDRPPDGFLREGKADEATRLRVADLLIDAIGTPTAAPAGARLGVAAAKNPEARERYCRLYERMLLQQATVPLEWLLFRRDDSRTDIRRRYLDALRTRNGIDAVDAIVPHLPPDRRPGAVNEERLARCIAGATDVDDGT